MGEEHLEVPLQHMPSEVVVVLVILGCSSPGGVLHPELMSLTQLRDDCAGSCLEVFLPKTGTDRLFLVLQVHVRIACHDIMVHGPWSKWQI